MKHRKLTPKQAARMAKGCPKPTIRGESNPAAVLTVLIVKSIRRRRGILSEREMAAIFGVNKSTIHRALTGTTWKHL